MKSKFCVLGIDLGTTNIKAIVVNSHGDVAGYARQAVAYDRPALTICELPADRFCGTVGKVIFKAIKAAGITSDEIAAVGYASQANSFLLLDESGTPLTPIISWQDGRVDAVPEAITELWRNTRFVDVTGLGLTSPGFAISKLIHLAREPVWSR